MVDVTGRLDRELNKAIRDSEDTEFILNGVCGQRYIACGSKARSFTLFGTPGNGLGQYMDGARVEVFGNCQEAVGDTMNAGEIVIHGSCGDACAYGMRGGRILIEGDVGYRAGIHMKAYMDHSPVLIVGGRAGSFLGEYLAGGLIAVLGIGAGGAYPCRFFCGTGMHGGKIILRCDEAPKGLPRQVLVREMTDEDKAELEPHVAAYCEAFGGDAKALLDQRYFVLTPNPAEGYRQLYTFE
ncbi:MAG: glutamate synthase [Clostridia bacterium]|nr:glutamate synthase [Clostridia bacterium]